MKKEIVSKLRKSFEDHANENDGIDFWFARDLQKLLDYEEWRNFLNVIEKAKTACKKSGHEINDHFVEVNKKVSIGSEAEREIGDLMLTRYACYLIAQNGDPRKYWSVLKTRLKAKRSRSVTNCNQLKIQSSDGKFYLTDVEDTE